MFKNNFIRLCNQKGVSPTTVCMAVGLSNATFSKWTEESVPRKATLMRIADYFGVTAESLLADTETTEKEKAPLESLLTPEEVQIAVAYRQHPEQQSAVRKLLDVPEPSTKDEGVVS